jgi:tetratricopeptide (TPR) repeat protein
MGHALSKQGKLEEAIAAYRTQVEVKPDHEQAWYDLGDALRQQGKLEEAIAAYRTQVEVKPDHKWAWSDLGDTLRQQGKLDEAIAAYRTQVEVKPDHKQAWDGLGGALRQQGKLEEALAAYRKQLEVKYAQELAMQPNDLPLLSKDLELALVQGNMPRFHARMAALSPQVTPQTQLFVILPFFTWLANPAQGWETLMTAIHELAPDVTFTWDFSDVRLAIKRLDASTQKVAQHFIDFFEGHIDRATLQTRLTDQ